MQNQPLNRTLTLKGALLWIVGAIAAFHAAYSVPALSCGILLFLACLFQLRKLTTGRQSFYVGLFIGLAIYAPHLGFFWTLFGPAALVLWLVLAFWLGLFLLLSQLCSRKFHPSVAALLLPVLWTGLEYFRSELYYLRFSWLNVGFVFQSDFASSAGFLGVYGIGFLLAAVAAIGTHLRFSHGIAIIGVASAAIAAFENISKPATPTDSGEINIAGVQLEFPDDRDVLKKLNEVIARYPSAKLLVLSEYTFQGPVPEDVKAWCRENERYLVVGGKEDAGHDFYNTAFVVGPTGEIEFKQAKSVPIQFFKDGLPAREQKLWNSPWGKIGLCVCYDLSYRRVVDGLVKQGAQAIIVPTMDVVEWGERQHQLHARVGPTRAAEYNIPLYRVCSSGVSQFIQPGGAVVSSAPFPGEGEMLAGQLKLNQAGRLPLDYWLAPLTTVGTAVVILLLMIQNFRRKPTEQVPTIAPETVQR